jgi:hypothetical protein
MRATNGHIALSPSDLTAYLACEHLSTLSLKVARSELAKPELENDQAELVFRKGREHEAAYLQRLKDEGKTVREISPDELAGTARSRRRSPRCATASTSCTKACSCPSTGAASPTS